MFNPDSDDPLRLSDFFRLQAALSPSAFYMHVDDNLRVTSYNAAAGVVLTIRSRILDASGSIQASSDTHTPLTTRSAASQILPTAEGWILGGQIFASSGSPLVGQCFVVVEVVRGLGSSAIALQTVAAGYVTAKQPLSWPGQSITSSLDGVGVLRSITGSTPAAGGDISETVPTGARWELLALMAQLTASAVVANRQVSLTLDDGVSTFFRYGNVQQQTASIVERYVFFQGSPAVSRDNTNNQNGHVPAGVRLLAGYRIKTITNTVDAGDQWTAPQMLVREWIEGA
jgi:hypothetical protein